MVAARCYCAQCRAAGGRAGARGRYGVRRGRRRFQPRLVRILSGRHGGGGVGIAWPQDQHPVQRRLLSRYGDAGCGERDGCAGDQAARHSHRTGGRLQLAGAAVAVGRRHRGRYPIAASERRRAVRSRRLSGIPPRVFHCQLRRERRLATSRHARGLGSPSTNGCSTSPAASRLRDRPPSMRSPTPEARSSPPPSRGRVSAMRPAAASRLRSATTGAPRPNISSSISGRARSSAAT